MPAESPVIQRALDLAPVTHWIINHQRPARQGREGEQWRTATAGHTGFPDLVISHIDRGTLFLEAKGVGGYPSDMQMFWLATLDNAYAVTIDHWPTIEAILTHKAPITALQTNAMVWFNRTTGLWEGDRADWANKRYPRNHTTPTKANR